MQSVGQMEQLVHEMESCRWDILGVSETRWKNQGERAANEGHLIPIGSTTVGRMTSVNTGRIQHSQRYREQCDGLPARLQPSHYHPHSASPFNITIIHANPQHQVSTRPDYCFSLLE